MRIAIDVSPLRRAHPTGVEKSLALLLQELGKLQHEHELLLLAPERPRLLWRERMAHRHAPDLWHSHVQALPISLRKPKVATLHEISWLECEGVEDEGPLWKRRTHAMLIARTASRIVCVSERTKWNFERLHPRAARRCVVIPHGIDDRFRSAAHDRGELETKYGIPANRPYFLTVGRAFRRKAFHLAVQALQVFQQSDREEHLLVMAGLHNPLLLDALRLARDLGLEGSVVAPGYIGEGDLPGLYAGASALLVSSESEGFGIPVLEAMAAGIPVIANRAASLPEVAGEAALFADFHRPNEVAEAMVRALGPERSLWRQRGLERAAAFPAAGPARALLRLWQEIGEGE